MLEATQTPICGGCKFYLTTSDDKAQGQCRRCCPVPLLIAVEQVPHPIMPNRVQAKPMTAAFWPTVGAANWCGEWVAKTVEAC